MGLHVLEHHGISFKAGNICLFSYRRYGQYSISKPFPFFILITILIQAIQASRSTWLLYAGWLVRMMKMSMVMIMGMRSKTDLIVELVLENLENLEQIITNCNIIHMVSFYYTYLLYINAPWVYSVKWTFHHCHKLILSEGPIHYDLTFVVCC